MKATMEPVAWVMRLHVDDDARIGAPYIASCTVTVDDCRVATLRGLSLQGRPTAPGWRAALQALDDAGCTAALYTRRNGSRARQVYRPLGGGGACP